MKAPTPLVLLLLALLAVSAKADIREDFERPAAFEPDIAFWTRIYTEVGTNGGLLHDRRYLGVVYEVVRFPEGAERPERRQHLDQRREVVRNRLLELARDPGIEADWAEEMRQLWGDGAGPAEFRAAADRIRFQLGQANRFRAGLERSGRWEAHIRQQMREHGVPEGMVALPHVESSFTPYARSRAGAAGMWQFTRGTGQRFMQVDHVVDERLDPWLSSRAAAQLLSHNYQVTGSWALALTAYNHGAAGVRRAVSITGSDDIARIAREYEGRRFGFASRNFYPAFLAALDIHAEPEHYFPALEPEPPVVSNGLEMPAYVPVRALADALDVAPDELRRLNPALLRPVWDGQKYVPRGYPLRLPASVDSLNPQDLLSRLDEDQLFARQAPDRYHVLRRGETLSHVADRYGVSLSQLVAINDLRNPHRVRAGQRLTLPGNDAAPVRERVPADGRYQVRPGDNLSLIAARFNTTVTRLSEINDLGNGDRIFPGQELKVATVTRSPEAAADDDGPTGEVAEAPEKAADDESPSALPTPVAAVEDGPEAMEPLADEARRDGGHLPEEQPELAADPSDYAVGVDGTIELRWGETLGHHADWLNIRTQSLRELNGLRFGDSVVAGQRLRLDFSSVEPADYESRRLAFHQAVQSRFFSQHRINGESHHEVREGDSLWNISRRHGGLPEWLLQQYNPDQNLRRIRPGDEIRVPLVERLD
ncbi:LysM peptidoglycan-binding domain-containing protein [Gammaproteobacteria bacterium AB-CW1]|uniref:LysM peptidoglycan-binding domain-containing protein n=1 Tax=Natronospira elongata TaxID=3110268 RepID=A0AAP6ML77_9GAMM|nr:LysM peptidoglycan-binding domain-containing protein [Gammaproteobacteria bacterium AB-CW1]